MRASRSCQQRRECARCARDRTISALGGEAAAGGDRLISMRWCRTSCMQARRWSLRLQSREAGAGQNQPGADAIAHSPGAALPLLPHSIDTAHATDRDDDCGCWPHTRRAGSHQLLYGVHVQKVAGRRDNATFHQAGEESPGPRSGPFSRTSPHEEAHGPRRERCAVKEVGELGQIQSCVPDQDEADGPTDSAEVPDPLRDPLPALLAPGGVRAPAIGVLFVVFI